LPAGIAAFDKSPETLTHRLAARRRGDARTRLEQGPRDLRPLRSVRIIPGGRR
jgi:hypothetical protein